MAWSRNDNAAEAEALRRGERLDLTTTMASDPLDEVVALHLELGIFAVLDEVKVQRVRADIPDERAAAAYAGNIAIWGAGVLEWNQPSTLPRTRRLTATGAGAGADSCGQQWAALVP